MDTFLRIGMFSLFVLSGLSALAFSLVMLGKFFSDITYDPDAEHSH